MPILKFLWLAVRPISKLESAVGWWDVLNLLIVIAYPAIGKIAPLSQLLTEAPLIWWYGIPALFFLIAGIKLQIRLLKLEQNKSKVTIDVKPKHPPVGREITLVVHNTGDLPAIFSANMTCSIVPGERQLTKISQLIDASMIWVSSGTDTETINADEKKVLKVCFVKRADRNVPIIYNMNFYIRELSKPEEISCAEYVEGNPSAPKVQIDITFRANLSIKGVSEWKYEIGYALPSPLLYIKSR